MDIAFQPIGVIRTPYTEPKGMPIQPAGAAGVRGTVEVFEAYREGLADLDGFSHIVLLYHLHRSEGYMPRVVPFLDTAERGLFATRAPKRASKSAVAAPRSPCLRQRSRRWSSRRSRPPSRGSAAGESRISPRG